MKKKMGRPVGSGGGLKPNVVAFANSVRGQYVIGQALSIASRVLTDPARPIHEREPSNAADMVYLLNNYPGWGIYEALNSPEAKRLLDLALAEVKRNAAKKEGTDERT